MKEILTIIFALLEILVSIVTWPYKIISNSNMPETWKKVLLWPFYKSAEDKDWRIIQTVVPGKKCPECGNNVCEAWDRYHGNYFYCIETNNKKKCGWRSH